jgi:hypothetical protein
LKNMEHAPAPTVMPRWDRLESTSRRDGVGGGRDGAVTTAARSVTRSTRFRETHEYRTVKYILLVSVLALSWSVFTRGVRVGMPGDPNAPRPEAAGAVAPSPDS